MEFKQTSSVVPELVKSTCKSFAFSKRKNMKKEYNKKKGEVSSCPIGCVSQDLPKKQNLLNDIGKNEKESISMGIGEIGEPTSVFNRQFRWTLKGENLSECFVKNVTFDYIKKHIHMDYYGVCTDDNFFNWVQKYNNGEIPNETFTFTTYDGCGNALEQSTFYGLNLVGHTESYDYASSDVAYDKTVFCYDKIERKAFYNKKQMPKVTWKLHTNDGEVIDIDLIDRPRLNVEETPISHLNQTIYVPGKAIWNPLEFNISASVSDNFNYITSSSPYNKTSLILTMYYDEKEIENWYLSGAWISQKEVKFDRLVVRVQFDKVQYRKITN